MKVAIDLSGRSGCDDQAVTRTRRIALVCVPDTSQRKTNMEAIMSESPDLLAILQATVDDEKILDMSGVADPAEFRAEAAAGVAGAISQRALLLGADILSGIERDQGARLSRPGHEPAVRCAFAALCRKRT
jgi:hypothetical protein